MKESKWNDDLVETLKELYLNQNLSTVEIAKQLGFTKNAVIGKIHRIGLVRNQDDKFTKAVSNQLTMIDKEVSQKKEQGKYLLEEIESNMCVWPYGEDEFTFCGEKVVANKPYCEHHLSQVYLPPKQNSKRKSLDIYTEADMEADLENEEEDIEEDIEEEVIAKKNAK